MVLNSDVTHKLYHFWRTGPEILHGGTFRPYKRPRAYKLGSLNQNLNRRPLISSLARFFISILYTLFPLNFLKINYRKQTKFTKNIFVKYVFILKSGI